MHFISKQFIVGGLILVVQVEKYGCSTNLVSPTSALRIRGAYGKNANGDRITKRNSSACTSNHADATGRKEAEGAEVIAWDKGEASTIFSSGNNLRKIKNCSLMRGFIFLSFLVSGAIAGKTGGVLNVAINVATGQYVAINVALALGIMKYVPYGWAQIELGGFAVFFVALARAIMKHVPYGWAQIEVGGFSLFLVALAYGIMKHVPYGWAHLGALFMTMWHFVQATTDRRVHNRIGQNWLVPFLVPIGLNTIF